jgi:hypothetical protein
MFPIKFSFTTTKISFCCLIRFSSATSVVMTVCLLADGPEAQVGHVPKDFRNP